MCSQVLIVRMRLAAQPLRPSVEVLETYNSLTSAWPLSTGKSTMAAVSSRFHRPVDEFSAVLSYISQLQLQDIDDFQSRSSGKARDVSMSDAPLSDEELAMMLFAEEAQGLLSVTKDYIMSSTHSGRSLIEELAAMEEMARLDREMALALSEGREPPARPPVDVPARRADATNDGPIGEPSSSRIREPLPQAPATGTSVTRDDRDVPPEAILIGGPGTTGPSQDIDSSVSSGSSASVDAVLVRSGKAIDSRPIETCTVCGDVELDPIYAPCGHAFDSGCLDDMFSIASVDESLYPPSCCQIAVPFDDVRHHLSPEVASTFLEKSAEFSVKDRVYCHESTCSAFLGPVTVQPSVLTCTKCVTQTCGSCKEEAHMLRPCSTHLDELVLNLGKEQGWQRCSDCHRLVELSWGCFHIQCICKHQFCYLCGVPWKTCTCPQFAVERIVAE